MKKNLKKYFISLIILIILAVIIIILQNIVFTDVEIYKDKAVIEIDFLLPMIKSNIEDYVTIESKYNECSFDLTYDWESDKELTLIIREKDYPMGQEIKIKGTGLPSKFFINHGFEKTIQLKCSPKVLDLKPSEIVSTSGPITIVFNTLIDEKSLKEHLRVPFDYNIYPLKYTDDTVDKIDYSHWIIHPVEDLLPETEYILWIKKGLQSQSDLELEKDLYLTIITDKKPIITNVYPNEGEKDVSIYPKIVCQSDNIIKKAVVQFEEMKGKVNINHNTLEFLPAKLLEEDKEYSMVIQVFNEKGERSFPKEITFHTMKISDNQLWVEVSLGEKQEVIIYEGKEVIRKMPCSGGKSDSPTVLGTFYLKDRGKHFFSERFGEGADYWVRITDQYLFHSIPQNKDGEVIESELKKIGQPASHGCIRLLDDDAKWFYDNVPENTMVIIHE